MKVNTSFWGLFLEMPSCYIQRVMVNRWAILYQSPVEARDRLVARLGREIKNQQVLKALSEVPRERFVPSESRHLAYEDIPLPIGYGQTISQPYIVALMTEALGLTGNEKVLEIGAGSGYHAAVLSLLAREVVSVERHHFLAKNAQTLLQDLGYSNVAVYVAESHLGWKAGAPYDAILVTAGGPKIPQELLDQVVPGGRMVIPVGSRFQQDLLRIVKGNDGFSINSLGSCRFVPLLGEAAWQEETETWDT